MTLTEAKLKRMTKDALVRYAYEIGCGERTICSERKGPYSKAIIIAAILERQIRQEAIKFYHVVAVNDRTGSRAQMTVLPMTHESCLVMKSKFTEHPFRRLILEEVV